jgi:hypothetical protein
VEATPADWLDPEEIEGIRSDADTLQALGPLTSGVEDIDVVDSYDVFECVCLALKLQKLRRSIRAAATGPAALQVMDLDGKDPFGIPVRERLKEHVLHYAEDGSG